MRNFSEEASNIEQTKTKVRRIECPLSGKFLGGGGQVPGRGDS